MCFGVNKIVAVPIFSFFTPAEILLAMFIRKEEGSLNMENPMQIVEAVQKRLTQPPLSLFQELPSILRLRFRP